LQALIKGASKNNPTPFHSSPKYAIIKSKTR
jgi:hypothetical protein